MKQVKLSRDQIALERKESEGYRHTANGRIIQPGAFEGEPIFAPYYWKLALEGLADSDNGHTFRFYFKNGGEDFQIWPELKAWLGRKCSLRLYQSDSGFIRCH